MKLHIHPDFIDYKEFIKHIPEEKYSTKETFCNERNTVVKVNVDNRIFVVKKYKVPNIFNRIVYTLFRKSKARRSFEYANRLLSIGIETAPPVAYIEERKNGFFYIGYFVSEYLPYSLLPDAQKLDKTEQDLLEKDFLRFTVYLHDMKIIHKDYNRTNIFFHKIDFQYHFALIDINRMSFGVANLRLCMQAVNQLFLNTVESVSFVQEYAELRHLDVIECMILLFKNRRHLRRKQQIKAFFKKKINS